MKTSFNRSLIVAALAVPVMGITLWPAFAQPADGGTPPAPPAGDHPGRGGPGGGGPGGPGGPGGQGGGQRSQWAEKYKDEVRDHPRLGRALVAMSEAKEYMEKAPGDLGGHKAAAIKSLDDSINQIKEAIKFDPKREPGEGGGKGKGGGGGKGGGEGAPKPPASK